MPRCEICGNDYDKAFEIRRGGESHVFDCFECAIQGMAPLCAHCGCRVIGHGVEAAGHVFCSAHCASAEGLHGFADRSEEIVIGSGGLPHDTRWHFTMT